MKRRFKIPIAFKLIFLTIFLLALTTAIIAMQSASRFEEISMDREEQASRDQTRALASEVEGLLLSYVDKAKVVGSLLMKDTGTAQERERALDFAFGRDRDFVAVEVIAKTPTPTPMRVVNEKNLKLDAPNLDKSFIESLRVAQKARGLVRFEKLFIGVDGYFEVRNSYIEGGAPLLTIGFPLAKDENGLVTHIVLAEIRLGRLQKIFAPTAASRGKAGTSNLTFLVDTDGNLIAHQDETMLLKRASMKEAAIVKTALNASLKQGQQRFTWDAGAGPHPYISVYTKTAFGVSAVRMVDADEISKAARLVKREAFYVAGRILSVALFAIFVFSITLTAPIEALAELANRVAKGDFGTKASVRSHDEVGELGEAFNHMIEGLVERDKVKNMFSKFHGSSVTEDLLKHGDLQLGGSKKVVTVFFSDVRDFTKFSEGHTPEEVVEMLNEYFQIMVKIINDHGGVVDKFIGDAIMAVWGAPNSTERDTQNAVKASIEMRKALASLNELRASRNQVPIKIGIGLHRGEAISGTIGSSERMEYTVIGDTVNQASRIESSTKAFGTDLLISDSLADLVQDEFIVEEAGRVEVKGKSEPLRLFKVRGYYDEQKNPIVVRTQFSDYEAGDADKVKMAG